MALILNIDTALASASVCVAEKGLLLQFKGNDNQKDHAAWIHTAIQDMLQDTGYRMQDIEAVAVSNGPGSYTGLRVGLSTAKGLCYALNIPLITIGTLKVMAAAAINQLSEQLMKETDLLCPMIDARRMEAYFAMYDRKLTETTASRAAILESGIFSDLLEKNRIIFFGSGSHKLQNTILHPKAVFADFISPGAIDMADLSYWYFKHKRFADLAYAEPFYIKAFYTPVRKPLK